MSKQGFESFIGIGKESGFGSQADATDFIEFNSEGLSKEINRIMSAGIRGTASMSRFKNGAIACGGDIESELAYSGFEKLIENAMGSVSSTQVGVTAAYRHIFSLLNNIQDSLSIEANKGGEPFKYIGSRVNEMSISAELDAIPIIAFTLLCQDELVGTDVINPTTAPTYPANELAVFTEGIFKINGAESEAISFELTAGQNLKEDKRALGSALIVDSPRNDFRNISGTFHTEFDDMVHYNRFLSGETASLELLFTGSEIEAGNNREIKIYLPKIVYNGETPQVGGKEIIEHDIPFTGLFDVSGSEDELQIEIQNTKTTV
jgi:hypothetical protein